MFTYPCIQVYEGTTDEKGRTVYSITIHYPDGGEVDPLTVRYLLAKHPHLFHAPDGRPLTPEEIIRARRVLRSGDLQNIQEKKEEVREVPVIGPDGEGLEPITIEELQGMREDVRRMYQAMDDGWGLVKQLHKTVKDIVTSRFP